MLETHVGDSQFRGGVVASSGRLPESWTVTSNCVREVLLSFGQSFETSTTDWNLEPTQWHRMALVLCYGALALVLYVLRSGSSNNKSSTFHNTLIVALHQVALYCSKILL